MFSITVEQSAAGAGAAVWCADSTGWRFVTAAEMKRMRMAVAVAVAVVDDIVAGERW